MSIDRRQFLKGVLAGGAVAAVAAPAPAEARDNLTMPPKAMGLLYDSTLCVGCKACVSACKESNHLPPEYSLIDHMWDTPLDLSGSTKNIIKMYREGKGEVKDREFDGYAFMKQSCLHCVDPSCVSACPVSAMRKDPVSGVVSHHPEDCIGCRYCVEACPFDVPRFQYDKAFPKIVKCELCRHLQEGENDTRFQYSACAQVCPTGATLYGPVDDLMKEAKRRLSLKPGTGHTVPRGKVGGGDSQMATAGNYIQQVYGEKELGGTQVLKLAAVPFDKLGYRDLPERSFAADSETLQHGLYGHLILPAVVLGGLVVAAKRTAHDDEEK